MGKVVGTSSRVFFVTIVVGSTDGPMDGALEGSNGLCVEEVS